MFDLKVRATGESARFWTTLLINPAVDKAASINYSGCGSMFDLKVRSCVCLQFTY